jgi:hypothetical protein
MSRQFFRQLLDPRRNINDECGYPNDDVAVPIEIFKRLYDRDAVANRVVQVLPKECWQALPEVVEDDDVDTDTEFEKAWDELGKSISTQGNSWHEDPNNTIWSHLIRADILSGIGGFGAILLGIDDGLPLDLPVQGMLVQNTNGTAFGDSPLTQKEADEITKNLAEPRKFKDLNGKEITVNREVNDGEKKVLNRLVEEGKQAEEKERRRRTTENAQVDALVNPILRDYPDNAEIMSSYTGSGGYRDPNLGMGYIPGAMGTDQQYFGVQFGPPEVLEDDPAEPGAELLFLRVFDESLLQIVRYEWNIRSPRFGMPIMYRVTLNDPREYHSGIGLPLATVFVHWTRMVHVADNLQSSEIFGVPRMRPVLNRLLDLEKLYSGSAEMYWRGAFPGLSLETHPQLGGEVDVDIQQTKDDLEQYMNTLQRYLITSGMTAKTLAPTVVDPSGQIEVQLEALCIEIGIPIRVFKGSERGELASSQDDASWNDRLRFRQNTYITPRVIAPFIDRLIQIGILPAPKQYKVIWPDLDSLTDKDKAEIGLQTTQALSAYVQGGVEAIMPVKDYYTRVLDMTDDEAEEIIDEAKDNEDTMSVPPAGEEGHPGTPPPPKPAPIIAAPGAAAGGAGAAGGKASLAGAAAAPAAPGAPFKTKAAPPAAGK